MKIRLRFKLLVYSAALAMMPLAIAGWTLIRITQEELMSSANQEISLTAEQLAEDMDSLYADTWLAPLLMVASGVDNQQLGVEEKLSLLRSGIRNLSDVVACQISAGAVAEPILISKDNYRQRLLEVGLTAANTLRVDAARIEQLLAGDPANVVVSEPELVPEIDDWLLTIVIPLASKIAGQPMVLTARISLQRLRRYLADHAFAQRGVISVVDGQGCLLLDPERSNLANLAIVRGATSQLAAGSRTVETRPYTRPGGERMLAACAFPAHFPWSVIVELDEQNAYLAISKMRQSLVTWVVIGLCAAAIAGLLVAGRISRPVEGIASTARAVGQGDLDAEVPVVTSGDEIADLAGQMREMIRGLRERDLIRETFGRYVSPEVARQVLSDPSARQPGGELRQVTILFSDLRGFTSLTEHLSPAAMVELLNAYLGRMAEIVARHGGTVLEYIGDAIMALFGAPEAHEDHALRAVACAVEMQISIESFNADNAEQGMPALHQGVGLNTGAVIVGNIGSEKRMKYGVVGDAVNLAARAESFTVGGEVLISTATHDAVTGQVSCRGPIEVRAKGKSELLRLYAVVAVGPPHDLQVPGEFRGAEEMAKVDIPTDCYPLAGKRVTSEALPGTIFALGAETADLTIPSELVALSDLRLRLHPGPDEAIDEVYAKVKSCDQDQEGDGYRCHIVFTSIPTPHRDRMKALSATPAAEPKP